MKVRLTTDASFCERTRVAAWAAVATSDRGRATAGGVLPGSFSCVNSAEIWAVAHGLNMAIDRGIICDSDHVIVQTDSLHAATRLQITYTTARARRRARRGLGEPPAHKADSHSKPDKGSPRRWFLDLIENHGLTYEVVRSGEGPVMREVDRTARGHMITARVCCDGKSIEAAHIAAFEDMLEKARIAWLRQEHPESFRD